MCTNYSSEYNAMSAMITSVHKKVIIKKKWKHTVGTVIVLKIESMVSPCSLICVYTVCTDLFQPVFRILKVSCDIWSKMLLLKFWAQLFKAC